MTLDQESKVILSYVVSSRLAQVITRLGFKAEQEETTTKLQSDQHNTQGFRPLPVKGLSTRQHPCEWFSSIRQSPEDLYF